MREPRRRHCCDRALVGDELSGRDACGISREPRRGRVSLRGQREWGRSRRVSVRHPWLKGPYLELLALLPQAQAQGIGSSIMTWFESAALQHGARNLWVCASSFNTRGMRFYERHGFTRATTLPGLVADGYDEILLRKFSLGSA